MRWAGPTGLAALLAARAPTALAAGDPGATPPDQAPAAPPASGVPAAAPPGDEVDEVVVVTAQMAGSGPQIRTVTAEDVERTGDCSIAEALERDVAFQARTGGRGERIFTLQGFDQRQVAVFVDGVPASVPYDGQVDLGKFPSSFVEEVQVAPGAAAGLYGPASLGGSVRIRTRPPPEEPEARVRARGAAHGAVEVAASGGGPVGPLRVAADAGARGSRGWPLPRDFEPTEREDGGLRDASGAWSRDAHLRVDLPLPRGNLATAGVNVVSGSFDVPTGLTEDRPRYWRFSQFDDVGASIGHSTRAGGAVAVEERLFFAANTNTLDSYDDATRTTQENGFHSTWRDRRWGGALSVVARPRRDGPLDLRGWVFADHQLHVEVPDAGQAEERVSTTLLSAALAGEVEAGSHLQGFLGGELDGEIPGQEGSFAAAPFSAGPSVGLRWTSGRIDATLGVARRSRAPTLKERFSEAFGYKVPNLDLGPESAWHVGLDVEARPLDLVAVKLSVHDAEVDGLIQEMPVGEGQVQNQNVGLARLAGAEGLVRISWPTFLTTRAAAGWLYARRTDAESPDDRLEYQPPWQVSLEEGALLPEGIEAWVGLELVGSQWYLDQDTLEWGRLGAWSRWDAAVGWAPDPTASVRLRATNLLDHTVQTTIGYPEPGREWWVEFVLDR